MSSKKREPKYEVISVRLTDDRLSLLERYRATAAEQLGRPVSMAEAAFMRIDEQLPEMERRASYHEQVQAPTPALDRIRKRWESEHALASAQWDLLSDYVQIGAEEERQTPPVLRPAIPSRRTFLALLDAFQAVYLNRPEPDSRETWYYFSSLGGHETQAALSDSDAEQRDRALRDLITYRRSRLQSDTTWDVPAQLGRCFRQAVRKEGVSSTTLDRVLAPYWPALWGLAARGHWIRHDYKPVRAQQTIEDLRYQLDLPDARTVGDFRLSFARSIGAEVATSIDFGPTRRVSILIETYPELIEFRTMLETATDETWSGRYFQASRLGPSDAGRTIWFRHKNAFLDLTASEWEQLRTLFREAWPNPHLQWRLQTLRLEYGEQGESLEDAPRSA
jgi:hypothetical protein